ncbi:MAG: DUF1566 domain-containing protein [Burkholderiales bacterium]|nr:DUF1566 domain-containing protein [Burkholderiales bacterium]
MNKHTQFLSVSWNVVLAMAIYGSAFAAGPTGLLNDTGITTCWGWNGSQSVAPGEEVDTGSGPRQDCRFGRDAASAAGMPKVGGGSNGFDFSKIANDGTVLSETAALGTSAKDWACTRDNVTGLVWEVKTTSGLRGQNHTYTWYNSDSSTNGGEVGTLSRGTCFVTGRCDTEKFVADVNAVGTCGATDWRMPSKRELFSITNLGRTDCAIDPNYFPNTPAFAVFFSASAWIVSACGYVFTGSTGDARLVRLVRNGQ